MTIDEHPPQSQPARTARTYWALQVVGWSLYFYAQASGEVIFAEVPWSKAAPMWGGMCLVGVALTQTLRWVIRRRWLALSPRALLARVVAAVLVMAFAAWLATVELALTLYGTPVAPLLGAAYQKLPPGGRLFNQFIGTLLIYVMWTAIYLSVVMQRRRHGAELRQAQLAQALHAAELRLLKAQLNPHFLFNALNSVRALIPGEPGKAQDAVTQLAGTLRYALASGGEDFVSLARELEMVDDYLALEKLRLAERLTVERDIDPAALTARVPIMLMQTLVENAIKHGIAPLKQGGVLRIAAHVMAGELVIQVSNTHQARATADVSADGIGLKNLSERLRLLFGSAGRLDLDLSCPGQAVANVRLPA